LFSRAFAGERTLEEHEDDGGNGPWAHFLFGADALLTDEEPMGQAVDKERLIELLEPAVAALGYELTDLDAHAGRRGLLRLYIGRKEGITTLEDCERVSEQVGAFLDVEDPLPGSYVLEVSSPGLDRRLRTLEHFERYKGEPVRVELKDARDGRRRLSGRLEGVDAGEVLVTVDGEIWRLAPRDIAVARLVPQP